MNKPEVKNTDKVATVYIIDDDPDVLESLEWLIESHGYHVKVYESASLFLDHYKHEMSGCILLDIRMPEIDGLELQRLLSERGCNLPTIFVTGHAEVPNAIAAIRCGVLDPMAGQDEFLAASLRVGKQFPNATRWPSLRGPGGTRNLIGAIAGT